MKCAVPVLAALLMVHAAAAQGGAPPLAPLPKPANEISLYPAVAPGSEKWDWSERTTTNPKGQPIVQDVVRPVLLHYPAERGKSVGTAMIVAPGGGFRVLMMSYEGVDIARRLNAMGIRQEPPAPAHTAAGDQKPGSPFPALDPRHI